MTGDNYKRREVGEGVYQCGCRWVRDPQRGRARAALAKRQRTMSERVGDDLEKQVIAKSAAPFEEKDS